MIEGASILVTGATGSFGRAFVTRVIKQNPRRLVVFSRGEHAQEDMAREHDHPALRFFIGDVRDQQRLEMAMRGIEIVIHAAALKIVPTAEYNPTEAIRTNTNGAENVIRAAINAGVKKVVALSTDKAVNPTNLYGATKLCAERAFLAAHSLAGEGGPAFSVVRYGNVVGSRGSVVPYFCKLARQRRGMTITHPAMTRFMITMDQAIAFVLLCLEKMKGNEIFVPRIPSMKIMDMAKTIWSQYQTGPMPVELIGIRPGEKLHEVLVSSDESPKATQYADYFVINGEGGGLPEGYAYESDSNNWWLNPEEFRKML